MKLRLSSASCQKDENQNWLSDVMVFSTPFLNSLKSPYMPQRSYPLSYNGLPCIAWYILVCVLVTKFLDYKIETKDFGYSYYLQVYFFKCFI